ncbi:helix-turn-helix transcriptional regulator [Heyndrickxia acidiproducens]|uniref:helix-turn-helix transcriptional regulator n=1 Tax=Heyndrickxia acidiproducens TaxID=1121084 RepID=UPI00037A55D1|nr:helix-turn-helix transcriptional regulator [Heyndrickxia acidiproducens]
MKSRIGEIIDAAGYKKKYIAKELGVSPTQLSNWISGRSYPTVEKAFKLAKLLNVKVDDLYKEDDENEL